MIADAHQHFWDLANPHPWLTTELLPAFRYGDYAALRRNYLPEDYRRDAARQRVVRTVHVEAEWRREDEVGETRWLHALRARHGLPTVVVAHARLERDDVDDVLAGHCAFPAVRGVRQKPAAAAGPGEVVRGAPGSMGDARWRRGYARLERYRLSFDLQTPWWHLAEAAELARDFPRTPLVVNHTGLPADRTAAGLAGWRRALETVAAQPNTAVKISGLGRPDHSWPRESNRQVVRDAIAVFGAERCMFASNFPVDSLCADFDTLFTAYATFVADFPPAARRALFHDNAVRIYRMDEADAPA
ncbi:MAG TPA: amidohydrolase family protein [Methylomirabilota bacterium]|nr:amidohydrolase family protein [Methylomirabilota bacterium]